MILELRLSNMYSLRDEMVLSLQVATIQSQKARELAGNTFTIGGEQLLKSVSIFGANASGKSSIIRGIRACVEMIRTSHNNNEDSQFGFMPFKFEGYEDRPSSFAVRFMLENVEYEYAFSMTRSQILTESLYYYPNGRRSLVFSRDESKGTDKRDIYEFKSVIKRPLDVAQNTSRKTLFLSRASQMDRELPKKIYRMFTEDIVLDYDRTLDWRQDEWLQSDQFELIEVLRTADSGIEKIGVENGRLVTYHKNNPSIAFDFETEESEGTKVLFRMMLSVLDIVRQGKLLLVDEIDTSLHTHLVEFIIRLFHKSKNAQLVYTSHNTHLLNTDLQRRDQVYFVNKRVDGSSDVYSLFDYKDYRDTMDMERAYLQGKFDAVPYIGVIGE